MNPSPLTPCGPGRWCLSGALDFSTVTGLASEAGTLFRDQAALGLAHMEIDLSDLDASNSAGLALLLEWVEMARERGIRLTYRQLPDSLSRIATFSNLQSILPLEEINRVSNDL
ncbi:STAS domain-containing protein [Thiocystis violascens]|uniref:Putative NTP binding protein (Contains STAS domain) n=1 Tax=Thiocystis violascens (strain ATCC 17096 / DSM 198 / 6111) TaxID=765911 RepID=I3YDN9_THIV6|nr:STAS domain-containing protein [Thiocystis violascens]AFL75107.1 putative NTP binding protein (contains STAS domain) [Thiocystis violascens DSM 198]